MRLTEKIGMVSLIHVFGVLFVGHYSLSSQISITYRYEFKCFATYDYMVPKFSERSMIGNSEIADECV